MPLEKRICAREGCDVEFEVWVYPSRKRPSLYHDRKCAAQARWERERRGSQRAAKYLPNHPLASKTGKVLVARLVLYEKLGPGPHPCHWCSEIVEWTAFRDGRGCRKGTLAADHLDGDKHNNEPENLVAACNDCNTLRGYMHGWSERHKRSVTDLL